MDGIIHMFARGLELLEFEVRDRKNDRRRTKKVRHVIYDGMDKEQVMRLVRRAYEAGRHVGASDPYAF